jgi:hypothetical protein
MADQWYKFGSGFLLVYSITDRPTFEALPSYYEHILRVKDKEYVPIVVASNKVCPSCLPRNPTIPTRRAQLPLTLTTPKTDSVPPRPHTYKSRTDIRSPV